MTESPRPTDTQVALWHTSLFDDYQPVLLCACGREIRKIDYLNPETDGFLLGDKPGTKPALSVELRDERLTIRCHPRCGREHRLTASRLQDAFLKGSETNAPCLVMNGDGQVAPVDLHPADLKEALHSRERKRKRAR